jgi:nucleoside-diphosphate-sugar epimerase
MTQPNPLADDLDHILEHTRDLWDELRGQRIFITGGTGFVGCWLLESFAWANDRLDLNAKAMVLSRNPEAFDRRAAHLCHNRAIQFLRGDVKDFPYSEGPFSHLIHSAIYQSPADGRLSKVLMANEMLAGTRRVLDFCAQAHVNKVLLVSTGGVYGGVPSPLTMIPKTMIPEDYSGSVDPTANASAYLQIRRMMESLHVLYAEENDFEAKIARCFSLLGPYLPLNGRFAVGDFIGDALAGRPITVRGDGKAVRSYLYMADLAIWLWTILIKGISCRPYNVGSETPTTIRALAEEIAHSSVPPLGVSILGEPSSGVAPDYYVPNTSRAQSELSLCQFIPLAEAVGRTMRWYREH